ncbi:MAG: hypothetical protein ACKPB0_14520, partial [Opitutaceae bacterium]
MPSVEPFVRRVEGGDGDIHDFELSDEPVAAAGLDENRGHRSRRGFATPDNPLATIHLVDISIDAKVHYHKRMTEIYLVLEGQGFIELDGEKVPAR